MTLCPSLFLLLKCCPIESVPIWASWALKAQLLWHRCAMYMWGFSIFPTAWQTHFNPQSRSLLMLSDNGGTQSHIEIFHPIYPRPGLILPGPCVSADLSWADVTEGTELEQEVVVGKGHLSVGNAAVVTYRDRRGISGNRSGTSGVTSEHWRHLHELWSRKSPEPSQFRKSPVSTQRSRHGLTQEFKEHKTLTESISPKQIYSVETKIISSNKTAKQR